MMTPITEKYPQLEHFSARAEKINSMVWEGHSRELEDVTHTLGGLGLGLLVYSVFGKWARPVGYTMLVLSGLLHVYAFMTGKSTMGAAGVSERLGMPMESREGKTRAA